MRNFSIRLALMVATLASFRMTAGAQAVATVTVSATVTASLAATNGGNLVFPAIIQGGSGSTILPSASGAGKVNIVGVNNAGLSITATSLPAQLLGPGGALLNIDTFQYCYSQINSNSACTATSIASGGAISGQSLSSTGNGYLWLGATLSAAGSSQTVGAYTGTMTITVTAP